MHLAGNQSPETEWSCKSKEYCDLTLTRFDLSEALAHTNWQLRRLLLPFAGIAIEFLPKYVQLFSASAKIKVTFLTGVPCAVV